MPRLVPGGVTMSTRRFWLVLGLLFLVALGKRVLTFCLGPGAFEQDAPEYWAFGTDVAGGDWLLLASRVDYRTPLYPMVLGAFQRGFGEYALMAVVIGQHLLLLGAGVLNALTCWRVTGSRVAALVGYGFSVACLMRSWFGNVILTEPMFLFFLSATVAALAAYHRRPSFRWASGFALLLALTVLVRPVPKLLWAPLVGLFFIHATRWAQHRLRFRLIAAHAVAAIVVFSVVLSPWLMRNWLVFGEPFLARLPTVNKWEVCFQGGSAARLPIPNTPAGRQLLALIGTPEGDVPDRYCYGAVGALKAKGLGTEEIDQLVTAVCADAIREHPVEFAWPAFKRFVNFWRAEADDIPFYGSPGKFDNQRDWRLEPIASVYDDLLMITPSHWWRWNETLALVVGCGCFLMVLVPRTRAMGLSLGAIFLYFAAVTAAVEVENYRYRMVLEPCLIMAFVGGFANLKLQVSPTWDALRFDVGRYSVQVLTSAGQRQRSKTPMESGLREESQGSPNSMPAPGSS